MQRKYECKQERGRAYYYGNVSLIAYQAANGTFPTHRSKRTRVCVRLREREREGGKTRNPITLSQGVGEERKEERKNPSEAEEPSESNLPNSLLDVATPRATCSSRRVDARDRGSASAGKRQLRRKRLGRVTLSPINYVNCPGAISGGN